MKTLFTDLPLCREIQRALADAAHVHPTPIQEAAIPQVLAGRDLLGCAQTGTGKTAAFALPVLHALAQNRKALIPRAPHVLILVPTRELAAQIQQSFSQYGRHLKVRHTSVYGGVNQNPQVRALKQGVHVLVATPGRLIDLMEQGHIRLDHVQTLILDEADRMLDMGFLPPLRKIIKTLPEDRQSLCFSATMPREIADLVNSMLRDPHRIDITPESSTTEQIEQRVLEVSSSDKRDELCKLLEAGDAHRVLVFTRTKRRADQVARQLHQADISADAIHGDKTQRARTHALDRFRHGRIRVLVATDVAARGIDVQGVSHVVNYDLPHDVESYVHRIGRTGRAAEVGVAVTFYEPGERRQMRTIERVTGQQLLPEREERRERKESERPSTGRPPRRGGPRTGNGQSRTGGERQSRGAAARSGQSAPAGRGGQATPAGRGRRREENGAATPQSGVRRPKRVPQQGGTATRTDRGPKPAREVKPAHVAKTTHAATTAHVQKKAAPPALLTRSAAAPAVEKTEERSAEQKRALSGAARRRRRRERRQLAQA